MLSQKIKQLLNFFKKNERYIYLEYGVLVFLIIWPLLAKGYVFAMDMAWPMRFTFPLQISNFYLIQILLWSLNYIIPSWLLQKIVIFLTFFCAGIFAHRLIRTKFQWPKYFAGFLYLLTPYLYSKFLYGQIWLCLAYALLPLLLRYTLELCETANWKNLIKTLSIFCLISFLSIHFSFISAIMIAIVAIIDLASKAITKEWAKFKKLSLLFLTLLILFLLLNSFWIIAFAHGENNGAQKMQLFDENQMEIFRTDNGGVNIFLNVLSMHGFWGDRHNIYLSPKQFNQLWYLFSGTIICLAIFGFVLSFIKKKNRALAIMGVSLVFFGVILSVGIAAENLKPLVQWLNQHIPFYTGFREPQKFVALIVLGYCLLCSEGLIYLSEQLKKIKKEHYIAAALLLVILYNPLMFNGFRGQLFVSNFPNSWKEANIILKSDQGDSNVLFLPWHLYMSYSFAKNKVIGPLGCAYFEKPIICSDAMELDNTFSLTTRPISKFMETDILPKMSEIKNFGELLTKWNIKYILLAKEVDWEKYSFLDKQSDLQMIFDSSEIAIYKNSLLK